MTFKFVLFVRFSSAVEWLISACMFNVMAILYSGKQKKMKFLILMNSMIQAATVKHDIEAMAFCQGKVEGFYENPAACDNYFFCWNQGKIYLFQKFSSKP